MKCTALYLLVVDKCWFPAVSEALRVEVICTERLEFSFYTRWRDTVLLSHANLAFLPDDSFENNSKNRFPLWSRRCNHSEQIHVISRRLSRLNDLLNDNICESFVFAWIPLKLKFHTWIDSIESNHKHESNESNACFLPVCFIKCAQCCHLYITSASQKN